MRLLLISLSLIFFSFSVQAKDVFSDAQKKEIEQMIEDTLMARPEIIFAAIDKFKENLEAQRAKEAEDVLADERKNLERSPYSPSHGKDDADVTIVEFFDYNCGYCKVLLSTLLAIVDEDDGVRIAFKELPSLGEASLYAAKAALAADMQGKYLPFHKEMMNARGRFTEKSVMKVAKKLGIDVEKLKKDMESDKVLAEIRRNKALARKLEIRGTPAFIIGDALVPGAIQKGEFQKKIERARRR